MRLDLSGYELFVFDCDGVLLDSNRVKSDAFYSVASRFGPGVGKTFLDYHKQSGGVSRYVKLRHLREDILGLPPDDEELQILLDAYANLVRGGLVRCELAPGLGRLRQLTEGAIWAVASGGDEAELREVFAERRIARFFDGGVHGSPTTKLEIVRRLLVAYPGKRPGLMFGDSRYDHECAEAHGLDFVFVADWTEVADWSTFCETHALPWIPSLASLVGVTS